MGVYGGWIGGRTVFRSFAVSVCVFDALEGVPQ